MLKFQLYFLLLISTFVFSQEIGLLKYKGGGDWYANPTSLPNLVRFCNQQINTKLLPKSQTVEPGSSEIFSYPFVHMTGHGNVVFSEQETQNLRNYMLAGGFLHLDDNYGMDEYVRPQIKKIFPDKDLIEIPKTHPLFNKPFSFPQGLPKIHEHDNQRPQALGIIHEGRIVLLYTFEADLGDGWEDEEVHNNPQEVRLKALKMGANIINYVFNQ